jgi:hypothetical protein
MIELHVSYDESTGRSQVVGPLERGPIVWMLIGCVLEAMRVQQAKGPLPEAPRIITPPKII